MGRRGNSEWEGLKLGPSVTTVTPSPGILLVKDGDSGLEDYPLLCDFYFELLL